MASNPAPAAPAPRFRSAGDRALVVEFGDRIDRALSEHVLRLKSAIDAEPPAGIVETVPTFRSLAIYYDPLVTSRVALEGAIGRLIEGAAAAATAARLWRVPICYDDGFAPDLAEIARRVGLSPAEVARRHSALTYHVYMLGFLPGFPYLGDLPAELALPRRAEPRLRVPAGSVAIATTLSAIYPYESPGGWHLIGTTPVRLFDAARPRPALLRPGDAVRFEPIDRARFQAIAKETAAGDHAIASEALGG